MIFIDFGNRAGPALCWLWESLVNEVDFQIIVSLYIRFLDDYLIFFDVQTGVEKLKVRRWKQSR